MFKVVADRHRTVQYVPQKVTVDSSICVLNDCVTLERPALGVTAVGSGYGHAGDKVRTSYNRRIVAKMVDVAGGSGVATTV